MGIIITCFPASHWLLRSEGRGSGGLEGGLREGVVQVLRWLFRSSPRWMSEEFGKLPSAFQQGKTIFPLIISPEFRVRAAASWAHEGDIHGWDTPGGTAGRELGSRLGVFDLFPTQSLGKIAQSECGKARCNAQGLYLSSASHLSSAGRGAHRNDSVPFRARRHSSGSCSFLSLPGQRAHGSPPGPAGSCSWKAPGKVTGIH